ncbi:hypothetical protein LSH36_6g03035 [Paralvinella palmiformis]|uniref:Uncharacterized protein n=1 Tax=Paralvinella palmiformis TaxID=53620 RepID=A0AAD9KFK5_9ANNE|nr:hypothetical protein LSH36_6g03035 [Paralvinella palmiformis]
MPQIKISSAHTVNKYTYSTKENHLSAYVLVPSV